MYTAIRVKYHESVTKENDMPTNETSPRNAALSNRTFGVEIEFIINLNQNETRRQLAALGLNIETGARYTHAVTPGWKIVADGSVSNGWEAVSPILSGIEGLRETTKMMDAIRSIGGRVNSSCGLHVHVGAADLTPTQSSRLIRLHDRAEKQLGLKDILAPSRRSSSWARPTNPDILAAAERGPLSFDQARRIQNYGRYFSLNMFDRCATYGTVEFRSHQGTLDAAKAVAWIILCVRMVESCVDSPERHTRRVTGDAKQRFHTLRCALGLSRYARSGYATNDDIVQWAGYYLEARRCHFAGESVRMRGNFRATLMAD